MTYPIEGLHHVTATVDEAQANLDFYVRALGLRLVKKTVNFDNHRVYHFYYGTEHGRVRSGPPFRTRGHGVRMGTKGAGQVTATSFSVPPASLDFWRARLTESGASVGVVKARFDDEVLVVSDPSGLVMELVANNRDTRESWHIGGIDDDYAVRGLHSVSLTVHAPARTVELLTNVLGFTTDDRDRNRTRLSVNGGGPGRMIDIVHEPAAVSAVNGLGTVHHVALAIASADEQLRLREDLLQQGYKVTDVMDRHYFQSIYFREAGGVLFEVATVQPGFSVDESPDALGRDLKLPAWEEINRPAIEAGLPAIVQPQTP